MKIRVHDKEFEPYLTADMISKRIKEIAADLSKDYNDKKPLFIAILNGSFMFASDLFKELNIDAEICFIKLASYKGTKSTGHVITAIGLDMDIIGRDIVIIEDIVDTGLTMNYLMEKVISHQPKSLTSVALLKKPDAMKVPCKLDHVGFEIKNEYVVGYGLDYQGYYRNLPFVARIENFQ